MEECLRHEQEGIRAQMGAVIPPGLSRQSLVHGVIVVNQGGGGVSTDWSPPSRAQLRQEWIVRVAGMAINAAHLGQCAPNWHDSYSANLVIRSVERAPSTQRPLDAASHRIITPITRRVGRLRDHHARNHSGRTGDLCGGAMD